MGGIVSVVKDKRVGWLADLQVGSDVIVHNLNIGDRTLCRVKEIQDNGTIAVGKQKYNAKGECMGLYKGILVLKFFGTTDNFKTGGEE